MSLVNLKKPTETQQPSHLHVTIRTCPTCFDKRFSQTEQSSVLATERGAKEA